VKIQDCEDNVPQTFCGQSDAVLAMTFGKEDFCHAVVVSQLQRVSDVMFLYCKP